LDLQCPKCGNAYSFIETTTTEWIVNSHGEREEKMSESTQFTCIQCGEVVSSDEE